MLAALELSLNHLALDLSLNSLAFDLSLNPPVSPTCISFFEFWWTHLIVCTVLLATLATLEQICDCALLSGHLVIINRFFGEFSPQLSHLITSHFLQWKFIHQWTTNNTARNKRKAVNVTETGFSFMWTVSIIYL